MSRVHERLTALEQRIATAEDVQVVIIGFEGEEDSDVPALRYTFASLQRQDAVLRATIDSKRV